MSYILSYTRAGLWFMASVVACFYYDSDLLYVGEQCEKLGIGMLFASPTQKIPAFNARIFYILYQRKFLFAMDRFSFARNVESMAINRHPSGVPYNFPQKEK